MEILSISFVFIFCIVIALTFFLGTNEKTHAQPWRFFIAAIAVIAIAFIFEYCGQSLINKNTEKTNTNNNTSQTQNHQENNSSNSNKKNDTEEIIWLNKMIALICSAFSGALASAAITNRAKYMHDKKSADVLNRLGKTKIDLAHISILLKALRNTEKPTDPYDAINYKKELTAANRLWGDLKNDIFEITELMNELKIPEK